MKSLKTTALLILLIFVAGCWDEEDKKDPLTNSPTINDARVEVYDVLVAAAMQSRSNVGNDGLVRITGSDITFKSPSEICSQPKSSATQSVDDGLERRPLPISPLRRHVLREWSLFEYSASNTLAARVVLNQHRELPENYLAAGHWMCLEGDLATRSIANAEVGAFVDAPELAGTPQLPAEGTVLYTGYATGMYSYVFGSLWEELIGPPLFEGVKEVGDMSGPISFQVDFTNGTVEACLGCVENVEHTGTQLDLAGNQAPFYNDLSIFSTAFSPIQLQQDGTFQGTNSRYPIADVPPLNINVVENDSIWGGKFSSLPAADGTGAPRLVAGTFRSSSVLQDGTRGIFFGNFFATKVRTQ